MNSVKQVSKSLDHSRPKVGFRGDAAKRRQRTKRAIKAKAETLRRLAQ
jgi:hypothetical protein